MRLKNNDGDAAKIQKRLLVKLEKQMEEYRDQEEKQYELLETGTDRQSATATLLCHFADAQAVKERYTVSETGVTIRIESNGEIGYTLPAFLFDGEKQTEIVVEEHSLTVSYEDWSCRYTTSGRITDLQKIAANRNGHYRAFLAEGKDMLDLRVEITKKPSAENQV